MFQRLFGTFLGGSSAVTLFTHLISGDWHILLAGRMNRSYSSIAIVCSYLSK